MQVTILLEFIKFYKQSLLLILEKFVIFTIFQNYTLALNKPFNKIIWQYFLF